MNDDRPPFSLLGAIIWFCLRNKIVVGILVIGMNRWERAMRIPGYGT